MRHRRTGGQIHQQPAFAHACRCFEHDHLGAISGNACDQGRPVKVNLAVTPDMLRVVRPGAVHLVPALLHTPHIAA